MLEFVEMYSAKQPVTASVIWLHGLGADGYDFANIVPELKLSPNLPVRFIFPHAPIRPVTLNHGMTMRSWFDIAALDMEAQLDETGLREASTWVDELIQQELQRGIPSERILLAGFSQGGAVVLYAGLRYPQKLGGIIALSTFLPEADKLAHDGNVVNKHTPIFMGHGVADPVVALHWAEFARDALVKLHYSVQWHAYPMLHQLCAQEIRDITLWIEGRLA
jgi:phospholipase/carboxylesterase